MCWKSSLFAGLVAGMVILVSGGALPAQEPDPVIKDLLDNRVHPFLEGVSSGFTEKAFESLLVGSPLAKQTEAVEALIEKTEKIPEQFGAYREYEQISAKRIGKDLVLMKFLYKCENFPVVWYFAFYSTPGRAELTADNSATWRVILVRFDMELELLGLSRE